MALIPPSKVQEQVVAGSGLLIASDNKTVSAQTATTSLKGISKPDNTTLEVEDGTLKLKAGTSYSAGTGIGISAAKYIYIATSDTYEVDLLSNIVTDDGTISGVISNIGILTGPAKFLNRSYTVGSEWTLILNASYDNSSIVNNLELFYLDDNQDHTGNEILGIYLVKDTDGRFVKLNVGGNSYNSSVIFADTDSIWVKITYSSSSANNYTFSISNNGITYTVVTSFSSLTSITDFKNAYLCYNGLSELNLPECFIFNGGIQIWNGQVGEVAKATSTRYGLVKVDGTTITVNNGVISASASTPYSGGTGITISQNNEISLNTASTNMLGGVKIDGTTITIDSNGVISASGGGGGSVYYPVFTYHTGNTGTTLTCSEIIGQSYVSVYKNGVILRGGSGYDYTINNQTGVITFATALVSTDLIATCIYVAGGGGGGSYVAGDGITINNSTISLNTASANAIGGVKVDGTSITINSNGVISATGGGGGGGSYTAGDGIIIQSGTISADIVTTVSSTSTDTEMPSARCLYNLIGDLNTLLSSI